MKLLVTGASGFIGSTFCQLAADSGHDVVALMRPRAGAVRHPAGTVVFGRIPYDVPPRAWDGVEGVVHCAGGTRGEGWAESEALTVEGTRVLLAECARRGIRRFVFLSSQSAHEGATSAYGRTKFDAEEVIRASGVPHAILRPGLVFGPGAAGLFARMRASVEKLPVLPLLGGGIALVQPVDATDLSRAILRCLEMLPDAETALELNLGEPRGMKLRDFLQAVAVARTRRRKPELRIPLGPVKAVVRVAEALRIPLPVSSDNLKGLENVREMETAPSLERLGMTLRPFGEAMREAVRVPVDEDPRKVERPGNPARVLLVGAGKIGIVHGLNLAQREGATLAGVVDRDPKAFGMYRSMGFRGPFFTDLDAAIAAARPDGAILATPAATHLPLARQCLAAGLGVLVEKPAAFRRGMTDELRALHREFGRLPCHTGYMAAQFPHLDEAARCLRDGDIGAVRGYWVRCLQSHIMAPKPVRWEMVRGQSGGGVLINFAGHWIAVLLRLLGEPREASARAWGIHSAEVEDAAEARLRHDGFEGRLLACWSIPGYARPHNSIVIEGETGRLVVEQYHTALLRDGATELLVTQQDYDTGYNFAPDYTGGGFSMEHANFARALRDRAEGRAPATPGDGTGPARVATPSATPVDFTEAARAEDWIFRLYDAAEAHERAGGAWDTSPVIAGSDMDACLDTLREGLR